MVQIQKATKLKRSIKQTKKIFKKGFELWYFTDEENQNKKRLMSCKSIEQDTFKNEFLKTQFYIFKK